MNALNKAGFEIIRSVITEEEITRLRKEADHIAELEGAACVRHMRKKSPLFHQLAISRQLLDLLPGEMYPVRSILFDKTTEANWPVAWHQDLTIAVKEQKDVDGYGPWSLKDGVVHVQPPVELLQTMITLRIHLDSTSKSNGALRVIPNSPDAGIIKHSEIESHIFKNEIICECNAGDILLMSPLILHASKKSQTPNRRRIIHYEYSPLNGLDNRLSWYGSLPPSADQL